MKVLVTGHKGYIGTHLVEILKEEGHHVTGCDINLFAGCGWSPFVMPDQEWIKDIRTLSLSDLDGFDCIMHLAALSNDAMGEFNPAITYSVNRDGSIRLADLAKKAGVPRFLFASSCSIYGKGESLDLDETAAFNPVSPYAVSKIDSEAAIKKLADDQFCPTYLRFATAYGDSPMLRIDLVANNLLASALTTGEVRVMSDGTAWRPLMHCRDIARTYVAFMNAPTERINNLSVNIGANAENFQVKDVVDETARLLPDAKVVFTGEVGVDPRSYRVNFDLLNRTLPEFHLDYSLRDGMTELHRGFVDRGFSLADFEGDRFVRMRTLKHTIELLAD